MQELNPHNIHISHICQNCGADLDGNYCKVCGQKGDAAYERSVFSILGHFFEELFTWDSRFFLSVKYLFLKPGHLTHEYISGRHMKYVSPLKMFLFTSFILFFIMIKSEPDQYRSLVTEGSGDNFMGELILEEEETSGVSKALFIEGFNNQFNDNITLYIFAVMLVFSVLLKIIYLPKKYYYSEHVVFTLHFFTFILWCFLLGVAAQDLGEGAIFILIYLLPSIYLFAALKKVYHKTLWKAVLVSMFMTMSYCILITMWIFGTVYLSAVRAV
ncbi:MAG TPA: DUF3667 domain-containing protein [Ignavibacteria bacterium]|nr:hypothetical protein [Bacteroidota bacterium]HRE11396.1 DUF3667 domain-containing protein [Ignavibacteria bacterium]HRF65400.1 DUF3667 domain-containing protein [Ignavibacteria bacterium]HRJ04676.1 DUF3667 domain-containing protein [Ignavibacteria bacterium]HRJ84743.1 DUF3667 domain-containing protein [Ignavibacteria bacterium]